VWGSSMRPVRKSSASIKNNGFQKNRKKRPAAPASIRSEKGMVWRGRGGEGILIRNIRATENGVIFMSGIVRGV